jgi:hypothetical protein
MPEFALHHVIANTLRDEINQRRGLGESVSTNKYEMQAFLKDSSPMNKTCMRSKVMHN